MHKILIGAPRDMSDGQRPALLQRGDGDFIESTLDDLRSPAGRRILQGLRAQARDGEGVLKLFQPIQRQFHLAVIEAWCDGPGAPRLDPAEVVSAGMVLRRVSGKNGAAREGWMRSNGRVRGWVPLARVGGDLVDPAAGNRLQRRLTGVAGLDAGLASHVRDNADNLLQEHHIPLYLAPPDVCGESNKTLFYGVVPTQSGEFSESEPEFAATGDDRFGPRSEFFLKHLADALSGRKTAFPFPGETVKPGWFDASEMPGEHKPDDVSAAQWNDLKDERSANAVAMREFLRLLRQLGGEFNAFTDGESGGKEGEAVRKRLHAVRLPLQLRADEKIRRTVAADEFLSQAGAILLAKDSSVAAPEMPEYWPALPAREAEALADVLSNAMKARFKAMKGRSGRFDEPGARYALRAFVRLKCAAGGPPRVVWSEESEAFTIAPWYEGGGAPPIQIPLPDPSDRALLKSLKPNVAFVVPPALQNLLSGKAKDLLQGKGGMAGPGLAWICSFNIPVITICAFLVLNIFLTLFNLVFGWLFFIKLCIPFPKLGDKPPKSP